MDSLDFAIVRGRIKEEVRRLRGRRLEQGGNFGFLRYP